MEQRIIKFRGISLDTGEWVYGYGVVLALEHETAFIIHKQGGNMTHNTAVDYKTVSEYTGKNDQKDVEIYEGDINQDKGIVVWNQDSASFCWEYPDMELQSFDQEEDWCLIVDNIHEISEGVKKQMNQFNTF